MPLVFLLLQTGLAGAQTPPANLERMSQSLRTVAAEAAAHITLADSAVLHYAAPRESAAWEWLFEKALYEELGVQRGMRLRRVEAAAPEWPLIFYAPLALSVRYSQQGAGKGHTLRRTTGRLYVKYQNSAGELLFAGELEHTLIDTIRSDRIAALENQAYPFTAGERKPPSRLKGLLEPFVITAVTGGIIYLFYSFRSN